MSYYAFTKASDVLILEDNTIDANKEKVNSEITAYLI